MRERISWELPAITSPWRGKCYALPVWLVLIVGLSLCAGGVVVWHVVARSKSDYHNARHTATEFLERAVDQGGWSRDLLADAVTELSRYRTDTLAAVVDELNSQSLLAREFDFILLTRCYRLEEHGIAEIGELLGSRDVHELTQGVAGLHLAIVGGFSRERFARFWAGLSREAKYNLISCAADEGAEWFYPFAGSVSMGQDPFLESQRLILGMRTGKQTIPEVLRRARGSSDPVFRGELGYATALNGNMEGLELLAGAVSRPSVRQKQMLVTFAFLFLPPAFPAERLTDGSDLSDLMSRDWLSWLEEREERLVFQEQRYHVRK